MASRSAPPPPPDIREFRDTSEIDRAVGKLQRRIADIDALKTDGVRWDDARVDNVQHDVRDTIRDVFGSGSPQFRRLEYFKIDDSPGEMVGMFEDLDELSERTQAEFVSQIPGATTRIEGLIRQLQEKREELAEPEIAPRVAFEGRSLNPAVANAAGPLYLDGHYPQAVFDASKVLIALVKTASARPDLDGANLMRTVFSRKDPILAFNDLADISDLDEQEGMMHLYEGAVMAIRNPGGHRVGATERPDRALQNLEMLSLLADRLGEAKKIR